MASECRDYYVYVLYRPCGKPCYVGKGKGNRWLAHDKNATNPYLKRIIAKAGGPLPKAKVREGLTSDEALAAEIAFIAAIGRKIHGGPLVNMTDGGDGNNNYPPEVRKRLGDKWRGKVGACKGRKMSEEQRLAISIRKKGVPQPAEARAKISATLQARDREVVRAQYASVGDKNRGRKRTPEQCERIAAAKKGKKFSPETWARIAAGQKAWRERRAAEFGGVAVQHGVDGKFIPDARARSATS